MTRISDVKHRNWLLAALILVSAVILLPEAAAAHEGQVIRFGSFLGGLTHPVLGLDHLLAMVSVGVVSVLIGGRAVWTVPATFVVVMALGGIIGRTTDIEIPMGAIEAGIAISVLALGVVIALDKSLPLAVAMVAVAFFATFHGFAHGAETPDIARPVVYAFGFLTGTAIIHLVGVLIGDIAKRYRAGVPVLRIGGAAASVVGALFLFGVM